MRYSILLLFLAFYCDTRYIPEDGVYSVTEELPVYGDRMKQLENHIDSSISRVNYDTSGTVFVSFVVDSVGNTGSFKIVRSLNDRLDSVAVSTIQQAPAKWTPGKTEKKSVSVKVVYPVKFE